jgi:hypothetical protein
MRMDLELMRPSRAIPALRRSAANLGQAGGTGEVDGSLVFAVNRE